MDLGETRVALTVAAALLLALPSASAQAATAAPEGSAPEPSPAEPASALSGEVLTRLQAELRLSGFSLLGAESTPDQVTLSASKNAGTTIWTAEMVVWMRADRLEAKVSPGDTRTPLVFSVAYSKESPTLVAIKAVEALERLFAERPRPPPAASEKERERAEDAPAQNSASFPAPHAGTLRSWRLAAGSGLLWMPSLEAVNGTLTFAIAKYFSTGWVLQLSPSASYSDAEVRARAGSAQLSGQLGLFEVGYVVRDANWTVSGLMGFGGYRLRARGESVPAGRGRTVTLLSGASSASAEVAYALHEAWALKVRASGVLLTPKPIVRLLSFRDSVQPLLGTSLSLEYRL